ncbi:uncharacterized protein ATNIH1004_009439 [Aspergillus tanneri]|uniref:Uncharacterized protein n=1 Tax=Aspergillus tanneri TaxID=1220188 RepID=A0A5M9MIJ8_9EURO|nr:uncharacterized protein ATNIH1004_009439 [Aspergillus tanneri]KAA8642687.1 hypothetical protein ATNIH1004_009439 [Aspergillus tanneri]
MLFQRIKCSRDQVYIFRDRTSRPSVAYRVWQPFRVLSGVVYRGTSNGIYLGMDPAGPAGEGSHYIYVRGSEEEPSIPVHTEQVDQAIQQITEAWEVMKIQTGATGAGEIHDANPWLRMTGWTQYLQEFTTPSDYDALYAMVAPVARRRWSRGAGRAADMESHGGSGTQEPVDGATYRSSDPDRSGAIRERADPISPVAGVYGCRQRGQACTAMAADISVHRTHAGPTPRKASTVRNDPTAAEKWRQLWQMASQISSPNSIDEADSTDERDPERAQWMMSDIERACLECCIKLMNQTYHAQEYESVLICAMAVLGRGEFGWQDAESYPPILSRVIKIARFMIVQKALWLDPDVMQIIETWQKPQNCAEWTLRSAAAVDNIETNSVYGSEVEGPPSSPPTSPMRSGDPQSRINISQRDPSRKTFQEQVTWMVSQLMVRGTHIPMETLQDWRTYGLKIYYNTTAPGHVTWMQPDRLLYKHLQFTMGDFRGLCTD